jgi:hypothetical protein
MIFKFISFIFISIFVINLNAQDVPIPEKKLAKNKTSKKHSIYTYWGWNRSYYTKSNIHFQGRNYDFTLFDVIAKDRQSKFDLKTYFAPRNITIPQYNFRLGYFLNDKISLSFGADHMKYVMQNNEIVKIDGEISQTGTKYDKNYDKEDILLSTDFLMFEHTDGLNYENIELRYHHDLIVKNKWNLTFLEGIGIGALIPRTNTTLLNNKRYDQFHLSGYGLSAVAGINFEFFTYFFIQFEGKLGFINMPDIRTTEFKVDRASQHFFFFQYNGLFGFRFPLKKKSWS